MMKVIFFITLLSCSYSWPPVCTLPCHASYLFHFLFGTLPPFTFKYSTSKCIIHYNESYNYSVWVIELCRAGKLHMLMYDTKRTVTRMPYDTAAVLLSWDEYVAKQMIEKALTWPKRVEKIWSGGKKSTHMSRESIYACRVSYNAG